MDTVSLRTVVLPGEFGIEAAAALHALLGPYVSSAENIVLEAPTASRVHTAALQVLATFFRARADAGATTAWRNPPAQLCSGAARLGLTGVLALPADPAN